MANGGIYVWRDGRTSWDTFTGVYDYGPLDDLSAGFQAIFSSRMGNAAGGVTAYYYSNGGMLDLDKNTVTDAGGLQENYAKAMGLEANLLPVKVAAGRFFTRPTPPGLHFKEARAPSHLTISLQAYLAEGLVARPDHANPHPRRTLRPVWERRKGAGFLDPASRQ